MVGLSFERARLRSLTNRGVTLPFIIVALEERGAEPLLRKWKERREHERTAQPDELFLVTLNE